jgi:nucleoside 2-deoxyribosyltransferase
MRVYISGALMGASDLERVRLLYESFASACHQADCEPYLPHQNTDPRIHADLSDDLILKRDMDQLKLADIVVVYLGEPSLGVGAEIALAIQQNKPILAVYESSKRISRFILGFLKSYPEASIYTYESVEDACNWIHHRLCTSFVPKAWHNGAGVITTSPHSFNG